MNRMLLVGALALAATLAGCDRTDGGSASASRANPPVPPATPSTAPASPDRGTASMAPSERPVEPTPSTHAGTPQPEAPTAPTARDTTTNQPQDTLSKSEEQSSMPKAGQVNNYNSPAYEPKKGAGGNR